MADNFALGLSIPSRNANTAGFFLTLLQGPQYFSLEKDLLNILCSICTVLSMVVLIELAIRFAVRLYRHHVDVLVMNRNALLSLMTGVLQAIPDMVTLSRTGM